VDGRAVGGVGFVLADDLADHRGCVALPEDEVPEQVAQRAADRQRPARRDGGAATKEPRVGGAPDRQHSVGRGLRNYLSLAGSSDARAGDVGECCVSTFPGAATEEPR